MKVRFAVSAGARPPEPERLHAMATEAERLGFNTLWFSDLTVSPSTDPLLSIAQVAAVTTRINLGTTIVPFGYTPYVFARQLAQLDRLCHGRLRVMLVPGLRQPGEATALGIEGANRNARLEQLIPMLRALWAGESIPATAPDSEPVPGLAIRPTQKNLQIWLAGSGPKALERAGRLADGWRGGTMNIPRAAEIVADIQRAAAANGRVVSPEHFGLTIGYAREQADLEDTGPIHENVAATGRAELRELIARLTDAGLSKFSLRRVRPVKSWSDELAWLADAVLDLQT